MILVCAAIPGELKPLIDEDFSQQDENLFQHRSKPLLLAALGIGPCSFLLGFARIQSRFSLKQALLTGTCGIYPGVSVDNLPENLLFSPSSVCLADGSVTQGQGYFPDVMQQEFSLQADFWQGRQVLSGRCLSPAVITADDALADQLGRYYQAMAEQMECFAFAAACREFNLAGTALFAVSNIVGSSGHAQWLDRHERVVEKSCRLIRESLPELLSTS
jgi:nucleoside phosphorylase